MREIKRLIVVICCAIFFIGLYFLCDFYAKRAKDYYTNDSYAGQSDIDFNNITLLEAIGEYANATTQRQAKISAVGDLMVYEYQINRAYNEETGTFDFKPSFEHISKYLSGSNYVIGNLDTTLAGKDNGTFNNFYGYGADIPSMNFNSPEAFAADLKSAGFNMVTTANYHSFDSGSAGVSATIDHLDAAGLKHTGTVKTTETPKFLVENINGINVGFLSYTNKLKDDTFDEQYLYTINILEDYKAENIAYMCNQIKEMRYNGAEAIVVSIHFGEQYASVPDEHQREVVNLLFDAGADVILGSGTHVLQPLEIRTITNSDGTTRKAVAAFSLGNFLSSQQYRPEDGHNRDIGMILDVIFEKTDDQVRITEIDIVPTFVHFTEAAIMVLPVSEVHDNPEAYSELLDTIGTERINKAQEETISFLLGENGLNPEYSDYKYKIKLQN